MERKRRKRLQFIRRKFPRKMQRKLVLLFMLIILAFVVLILRITYINAANGEKYTKTVLDQQQYTSRTIPFKRGDITDRNGTKLATSERVYNVILDAAVMCDKKENIEPTKKVLKDCFGIEENVVDDIIQNKPKSRYNVLAKKIDYKTAKEFEQIDNDNENYPNVAGIWLEEDYIRKYPYETLASDVLGFTVAGNEGSIGLELYYNSTLNGTDGREYGYQGDDSTIERTVKEPHNGDTVVTTIDMNVQQIVEKHIMEFNEKYKGSVRKDEQGADNIGVIVMNPNTGEIYAEASYPNFNPNNPRDLTAYFKKETIEKMKPEEKMDNLNKIWRNFCVSDTFEPGSTIKPFTVATGLEDGKLNGNETFYCNGYLEVGEHKIGCSHVHGNQTLKQSIANSCNVAMMHIAAELGPEEFIKYQHVFGFGEYTGIDLPGEGSTASLLYSPDKMRSADLATNAFGQNFNVTMTQLSAGFASLINGGNYYQPHIVKQIQNENGNVVENIEPVLLKKTISKETSDTLKNYMLSTVNDGTGKAAAVKGYDIGGKTGTAEKRGRNKIDYLVSFIGYAPQDNPEVMVYVVVDRPNTHGQASNIYAVELAQKIMEDSFPYLNVTKAE